MMTSSNFRNNFGKRLQELMDRTGISQNELARRMGVSKATVSRWLNGSQVSIMSYLLFDLCDIFGVDPLYFCNEG